MEPIKTLGKLLGKYEQEQRDAIHIAIMPVVADDWLSPGQHVKFAHGTQSIVCDAKSKEFAIGVIDPFLDEPVQKGNRAWMFLFPGTITGLRHEWTHPAIDDPPDYKNESEKWLREFANKWNFRYDEMIQGAQEDGGYVVAQGVDIHSRSELDDGDEVLFWHHIEVLTGRKYDENHREQFGWSCSC